MGLKPQLIAGRYLSDGRRLVWVLGDDDDGGVFAEDALSCDVMRIYEHELRMWHSVRPSKALATVKK